jgi:hypothetical protein
MAQKPKRLLFLDLMRGFFITYLIFIHGIAQLVLHEVTNVEGGLPEWATYVISPFIVVATWAPLFAMVSGVANTYSLQVQFLKNMKEAANISDVRLWDLLRGQLWNSFFVYILSLINMGFFHYPIGIGGGALRYSTITGSIDKWVVGTPLVISWGDPLLLFFSDALALIALSGFITCFTSWIIWRKGGVLKVNRNFVILSAIGVLWVVVSPFLHDWLYPIFMDSLNAGNYLPAILLKSVIGPSESTFPNVAFAIFGQIFGIALAMQLPKKKVLGYGYVMGGIFTSIAIYVFLINPAPNLDTSAIGSPLAYQNQLLNLGLILILATFLIGFLEYKPPEKRIKLAKLTRASRRFGLIALTVFILEGLVSILWKKIYMTMLPFIDFSTINIGWTLLYLVVLLLFWYFVVRVWARFNFKFSFEWILVQVVGRLRGRMSNRLNVKEVLDNIEAVGETPPATKPPLQPSTS